MKTPDQWLAEYYPIDASKATGSMVKACEHSLRKWRGLRKATLLDHGLKRKQGTILDAKRNLVLAVNSSTCALCRRHPECYGCPLFVIRENHGCDVAICGDESYSPFWKFIDTGNAEPMIAALEKALAYAKERKK